MTRPRFLADEDLNAHLMLGLRRREPTITFASIRDFGLEGNEDAKSWTMPLLVVGFLFLMIDAPCLHRPSIASLQNNQ